MHKVTAVGPKQVVIVLYANRAYGIFDTELARLGLTDRVGSVTGSQVALDGPALDFVALAKGHGELKPPFIWKSSH
eukprot:SAG31_NODE_2394_length_5793_cov_2.006674_7_plen_76_part_00